jgi:hypothetical protein
VSGTFGWAAAGGAASGPTFGVAGDVLGPDFGEVGVWVVSLGTEDGSGGAVGATGASGVKLGMNPEGATGRFCG